MPQTTRAGLGETLDNQRIMKLVEEALQRPEGDRERYLKQKCADGAGDFAQAWDYVQWEQRMQGFLLDPVIKPEEAELKLEAGDLLEGRFRIVREIAQGGMGVVYEAQDEKLGRRIALKCAKAGFGNELPPEVRHATEVSHPNVCKIYEIHTAKVRQQIVDFITMEFLEGETLSGRLQRGLIPQREAFAIARQLASGLAEAHHNGVVHGDIKSHNVILTKSIEGGLRAVITDFGLARRKGSRSKGIWGTPGYMAPELWMGADASAATDIYALGVVFFEMATGDIPNKSQTTQSNSRSLKATPWYEVASQKPPPVNAQWDRVLGRCMAPQPEKRYQTADQIVDALTPGHVRRNSLLAAAAVLAIAATGIITYKSATAPPETVKLAMLPVENFGAAPPGQMDREIARLKGTAKTAFELLPASKAKAATHILRASLAKMGEQTILHAVLSDSGSQAPLKTWDVSYSPGQLKYAPGALAGVVSAGLHLTPLPQYVAVNDRARSAYLAGTNAIRQDSTVDAGLQKLEKAAADDEGSPLILAAIAEGDWMKYVLTRDNAWLERSREAARQSEMRYPDTGTGHRVVGLLKAAEGRFEEAEAELLRAIELEPGNAENLRQLARVYQRNNQFDKALLTLRKAVELQPDYYKNQQSLGEFYFTQARYAEAVEHLLETVKLMPSASYARYELAMAYTDIGEFDKARENLDILLREGTKRDAGFQVAKILMYQGKDKEALPYLLTAVKEAPASYVYWMHLGIAQRRVGHLANSRKSTEQALALVEHTLVENPRDGVARSFLGYFCAQLGQPARGESEAEQARQLAPRNENVLWMAILTYEALGKRDEAISILRTAPVEMLADLKRWPDVADLTADLRFKEMTAANAVKKE